MKILLFGKTGLLGSALFDVLSKEHTVIAPIHIICDVTNKGALTEMVTSRKPDLVINATGYTKVDDAETNKELAYKLNEGVVANFIEILKPLKTPFLHFSTDYIFNGEKKSGYVEDDSPAPLSVYAASKLAGEELIKKQLTNYYLVRTAWVYGPGGKNFVDAIIEKTHTNQGKPLTVVNDQVGSPTFTLDIAGAVLDLLKGKPYGIYHIVNEGSTSWFDLAKEVFYQLGVPQEVLPITTQELNRPSKRPAYSILLNTKLPPLRPWTEALEAYLRNKTVII